ncbi:histone-lysine N-methyltransferase SETDB1-A isoform X2 [Ctenopharyngodon idella]|uniref:histone-lysine N-methyltransferase SETDB1-A isoform X2 n=1 Tax=Ctenopharyngodon idella TaxID=7959 RepID=UPI002230E9CE|nr:histone-lysine N-methyltransferase SETDB1-A isoform X2 [Ctenopharyngodon idella]
MSSGKDDNLLRMTKDDLQRWIQAEVERNPHLAQRREQLAQVEEWVKQREKESTYTRLLYSNACESVFECESVMKGLYGMLGLDYRDEDSEEEGGGGPQDVIHITDDDEENRQENSVCNGDDDDDDDIVVIDLGATKETLEPMLEKVTMAIQKSSRLVQDLVQMVNKTSSISTGSPSSDISNRPSSTSTPETSCSESVTPKLEMMNNSIAIVKTESLLKVPEMSSFLSNSGQCKSFASYNSDSRPAIKTEPQLTALTPWEMSISKQHDTTASHNHTSIRLIKTEPQMTELTPWEKNISKHKTAASQIKTEPQLTAVTPSEMSLIPRKRPETIVSANSGSIATIKSEPHLTIIKPEMSSPQSNSKRFEMLSGYNLASIAEIKTEPQIKAVTPEINLLESDFEQSDILNSEFKLKLSKTVEIPSLSGHSEQLKTSAGHNLETDNNETDPHVTPETPLEMSSTIASADTACLEINQAEPESTTTTSEVSQSVSKETENIASDDTTLIETNQTEPEATTVTSPDVSPLPSDSEEPETIASCDLESMDKTEKPTTRSKSAKPSVSTTSPTARLRSSKNSTSVTSTSSPKKGTTKAPSPAKSIDEPSDTEDQPASPIPSDEPPESPSKPPPNQTPTTDETTRNDASAEPSKDKKSSKSSSKSSKSSQAHKEMILKVSMGVLGKRKPNVWCQGTVEEVQTTEKGHKYKVEFKKGKQILLPAHHVAPAKPPVLKDLFVGCRVVASYKDDKGKILYNGAVLVELPERKNRMRFMVFYDDGKAAYLALPDIHVVCKQLKKVWRDIEDEACRSQVKEYLRVYPNPIAVVLRIGQDTRAVRNDKFESCTVLQLDGSLIQICFKKDNQKEWIYKGSDKLEHIVNIKKRLSKEKPQQTALQKTQQLPQQKTQQSPQQKSQEAPQQKTQQPAKTGNAMPQHNTTSSSTKVASATVTSTTVTSADETPARVTRQSTVTKTPSISPQNIMSAAFQPKVILQKLSKLSLVLPAVGVSKGKSATAISTSNLRSAKRPAPDEEEEYVSEEEEHVSEQEQYKSIYLYHRCCPACLDGVRPSQADMHRGQNPLLIPLLFKFRRMTARRRIDGKVFFHIFYRSPCGRSLCDMQEVQEYLFETRCDFLFLEMFCMDPFVLVNRARPPSTSTGQPHLYLPDISEGKEVVPVPCVNEVDNTLAPNVTYTKDRSPAPGVNINTSLDFLIGCDCTDGCRDRSKCACHQLTIEATSLCSGGPVDVSAGYTHKRLPTSLPTGVYECNPLCRCDPRMCSNRLVQHGMQLRLELFMTQHKGWGIRCRDDVAKGTFVCVFTGKIVNEDKMNEDDTVSGNEYLANLDFIEGVEKLKEGYESEAYCSDTEVESNKKTITMKTGPLWKNTLYQEDSSSGEEREEPMELATEQEEMEVCDESLGETKLSHKPHEAFKDAQRKVTKQIREDGQVTSGPKRCFAIKSSQRRVKPLETTDAQNEKTRTALHANNTRRLFNDEETCYIIDARQEGNLGRYINHSCSPNLFVQNVFVDTHDLRFPWVAFFASKRIKAGTELTWDYNYEVGSVEGKVLLCCCGSLRCTGRLL